MPVLLFALPAARLGEKEKKEKKKIKKNIKHQTTYLYTYLLFFKKKEKKRKKKKANKKKNWPQRKIKKKKKKKKKNKEKAILSLTVSVSLHLFMHRVASWLCRVHTYVHTSFYPYTRVRVYCMYIDTDTDIHGVWCVVCGSVGLCIYFGECGCALLE